MPTGYTADLHDGKPQTFAEFVMECARAFGALVMLRDEPDAPIPDRFEPSPWAQNALDDHRERQAYLICMSAEQAQAEANRHADEEAERRRADRAKQDAMRGRYEAMLAEVRAWEPPTHEHQGLKHFMEQQLTESIRFDCTPHDWPEPTRDGELWRAEELARLERSIVLREEDIEKERERAEGRTLWIQALRASLAAPSSRDGAPE